MWGGHRVRAAAGAAAGLRQGWWPRLREAGIAQRRCAHGGVCGLSAQACMHVCGGLVVGTHHSCRRRSLQARTTGERRRGARGHGLKERHGGWGDACMHMQRQARARPQGWVHARTGPMRGPLPSWAITPHTARGSQRHTWVPQPRPHRWVRHAGQALLLPAPTPTLTAAAVATAAAAAAAALAGGSGLVHADGAAHEVGVVELRRGSQGRVALHGHEAEAAGAAGLTVCGGDGGVWAWVCAGRERGGGVICRDSCPPMWAARGRAQPPHAAPTRGCTATGTATPTRPAIEGGPRRCRWAQWGHACMAEPLAGTRPTPASPHHHHPHPRPAWWWWWRWWRYRAQATPTSGRSGTSERDATACMAPLYRDTLPPQPRPARSRATHPWG